jgi:hypothetical protein
MDAATSVRELVQKYRVCYEVAHELGPMSGSVRPIGFAIELAGTHDHSPAVSIARCPECAHAAAALQAIAYAALPGESADVSFRVQEPRIAHHFTPKHDNRPDLTATITVLHEGGAQHPVDEPEVRGRDAIVAQLTALGVPEGSWREAS